MMSNVQVRKLYALVVFLLLVMQPTRAQKVYFVDGFHGGIYGHYPKLYTGFINDMLKKHPDWSINLEIEPETWDSVKLNEPANYATFKTFLADQSSSGRVEYVNPSYGQPYFYNINGESIIRQFSYGIRKMKQHFPGLVYSTYSSEEPCFTSALPQILASYGFKYASLKNPNTCWGGYTRAYGGEMINWTGPDGTVLPTIPRYATEDLDPNSTWQTTASTNSPAYISSALNAGIRNPVGMCLQDAGWKFGPWLLREGRGDKSIYTTWRNYVENVVTDRKLPDWNFSQEDVLVSLVWGSQVLQQIARQVRFAENKIVRAEKFATLAYVTKGSSYPVAAFDEGWRQLMLAQHHDCWIVPYNGRRNFTWIDRVRIWTNESNRLSDSALAPSWSGVEDSRATASKNIIRVFNANAATFRGLVTVQLPALTGNANTGVFNSKGKPVPVQVTGNRVSFMAEAPGTGFSNYQMRTSGSAPVKGSMVSRNANGFVFLETDLYRIGFDPGAGGAMVSLMAKKLGNKQFVNADAGEGLNVMKGYFFRDSTFYSSSSTPATITVVEDGPMLASIRIDGFVQKHPFSQTVSVTRSGELIDVALKINWIGNPGIGDGYKQAGGYKGEDYRKAFYDDSKKLQTLFPLNLENQKVFKNAPFDVTRSGLGNTVFSTWDSIKNNVMLNWVDVTDGKEQHGLALFSDHTTNYLHGTDGLLGLTTQYSGVGLWGRDYSITGPTEFHYALYPHAGNWNKAAVWKKNVEWNNPVEAVVMDAGNQLSSRQLFSVDQPAIEISSVEMDGADMLVRFFNPQPVATTATVNLHFAAGNIKTVELDGRVKKVLPVAKSASGRKIKISLRRFGIETIRISGISK